MKLSVIKVFCKILKRKIVTYQRKKSFFQWGIYGWHSGYIFSVDNSIVAFGEAVSQKKAKALLIEKNFLQRGPRGNYIKAFIALKSYIKAFQNFFVNIVPNLIISTAHLIVIMLISSSLVIRLRGQLIWRFFIPG